MIIGLTGLKGSGKTTAAVYIEGTYIFRRFAFARKLKRAAKLVFGLSRNQLYGQKEKEDPRWGMSPREIMQKFGEAVRGIDEDVWVKSVFMDMDMLGDSYHRGFVIEDVRHLNEVEAIRARGGVIVGVKRPGIDSPDDHRSELEMYQNWDTMVDYEVRNDGDIPEFHTQIDELMQEIRNDRTD